MSYSIRILYSLIRWSIVVSLGTLAAAPSHAETIYDVSANFDTAHNPSQIGNVYSYGLTSTLTGSPFNLLNTSFSGGIPGAGSGNISGWDANGQLPLIAKNVGNTVYTSTQGGSTITVQPGQILMHPGANGEYADVRFTALVTGAYSYTGTFNAADSEPTTTDVHVLINGVVDSSGGINVNGGGSTAVLSDPSFLLTAGQTVDFVVGYGNGSYFYDSTGFNGNVTLMAVVPEPASLGMLAIGLAAIGLKLRRRRAA